MRHPFYNSQKTWFSGSTLANFKYIVVVITLLKRNVWEREAKNSVKLLACLFSLHRGKRPFPGCETENGKSSSIRTIIGKLSMIWNKASDSKSSGSKVTCIMS